MNSYNKDFEKERDELIADLVNACRINLGLNKTQFSQKCGISKQYFNRLMKQKSFTSGVIDSISKVVGFNINSMTNEEIKNKLDETNVINITVQIQSLSYATVGKLGVGDTTISLPKKYFGNTTWYGFVVDTLDLLMYGIDVHDILLVRDNAFSNLMLVSEDGKRLQIIQKNEFNPNKYTFYGSVANVIKEYK